eukprot:scaffold69052_cov21-Cyclotella_meneghiniana.AAC.2
MFFAAAKIYSHHPFLHDTTLALLSALLPSDGVPRYLAGLPRAQRLRAVYSLHWQSSNSVMVAQQ